MDRQRFNRWIGMVGGAALFTAAVVAIAPLAAQQAPPSTEQGRPGPPGRGFGSGRGGRMGFPGVELTDAQREQAKAIRDRHAETMRPLVERAQAAQKALADATRAGAVDVNQLRVAANEVGAAEGELAFARAQVEAEMLAVLTPAQREQMEARRKEMETRGGPARGRGGRRGGPAPLGL